MFLTGQEHDENTGLIYFGARYYDPDTGRFISQDMYLGQPGTPPSLHRYLYAYSNPTVYVDLYGFRSYSEKEIQQLKDEGYSITAAAIEFAQAGGEEVSDEAFAGYQVADDARMAGWELTKEAVKGARDFVVSSVEWHKKISAFFEKHPEHALVIHFTKDVDALLNNKGLWKDPKYVAALEEYIKINPSKFVDSGGILSSKENYEAFKEQIKESFDFTDSSVSNKEQWKRAYRVIGLLWGLKKVVAPGKLGKVDAKKVTKNRVYSKVNDLSDNLGPRNLNDLNFDVSNFKHADDMQDKVFTKLVKDIDKNGIKNKVIKYVVDKDGRPIIVDGNNRFEAAKLLGKVDELEFLEVTPPIKGTNFNTLDDVVEASKHTRTPRYRGKRKFYRKIQ